MECAQINVIGGTGAKTPATVSLPGAYKVCLINVLFVNIVDIERLRTQESSLTSIRIPQRIQYQVRIQFLLIIVLVISELTVM
jgi:hypothetical protein